MQKAQKAFTHAFGSDMDESKKATHNNCWRCFEVYQVIKLDSSL
jgi:hypothetical protein